MHRFRRGHYLFVSPAVGVVLAAALAGCAPRNSEATAPAPPKTNSIAPAGAEGFEGIEWVRRPAPGGTLTAAVARPPGKGPFPVLVILHGTHGFARQYVRLAQDLAPASNVVAVAACWFKGGEGAGRPFVTPIDCPDAPAMPDPASDVALDIVGALVSEARTLPGVRSDRVALFGHSRGGAAALYYVLETGGVQALVLNSTGYPKLVVDRASAVSAPLLLLHGTADGPGDGSRGNERTAFANVGPFVAALQKYEKPFEKKYFDGAGHNGLFTDEKQHDETVKLVAAFLRKELAK